MESKDKKDEKLQTYSKVQNTKKSRAHKKQLYINLKNQMEFYFSPSNLAKDRFLAKKIGENPFVPLSTFLTFNKIKILLTSIPEERREETLIKSVSQSERLEINNEGTSIGPKGDLVKRDQAEIDECTIYVEQIPLNSSHEIIKSIFTKYGQINYISLPKYKQSRQLKQFGFVEFADKENVQKCIDDFKKFDGVLHCSKPDKLLSIATFESENKGEDVEMAENEEKPEKSKEEKENSAEKSEKSSDKNSGGNSEVNSEKNPKENSGKILEGNSDKIPKGNSGKISDANSDKIPKENSAKTQDGTSGKIQADNSGEIPKENPEENAMEISMENSAENPQENSEGVENPEENPEENSENSDEDPEEESPKEESGPKKKNRKHKRKNKKQKLFDERAVTMRIMRKSLWKKLRNEYLNLERQKAKEIKKILQDTRKSHPKEQAKFSPVSPRINFYKSPSGKEQEEVGEEQHDADMNTRPIVNIKFREPCNDLKELRQEFRQFSYVQHVEIVEGGAQCNVRVTAQSSAQELVSLYSGCEYEANVISGEAEKDYWKRITEIKEKNKTNEKNPNRKQRRGREKLAKMISKASNQHIRFNESAEPTE